MRYSPPMAEDLQLHIAMVLLLKALSFEQLRQFEENTGIIWYNSV